MATERAALPARCDPQRAAQPWHRDRGDFHWVACCRLALLAPADRDGWLLWDWERRLAARLARPPAAPAEQG